MKRYKSFILFGALALSFAACNTDDLEQNIDALETRVQGVEAQVQALNNNMNVIRVLLDGNKTIQTATKAPDGTWTLLLSNGETLTLTPGNTVNTTYPVIEISDDGYWVIEGVKSERRAKADDGKAADITPQFQIVEEGDDKVWQVSYDEGATWEYVTDETGAHVSATGTSAGTNPIAEAKVEGNNFKITLTDGDAEYTIPIIADLVCQITDPVDMENGKWYVDGTESFTVTVSEGSDVIARVVVPAEWDATMTDSGAERTVRVTAPSTPSECILVVEVTKGVNTVTDEIVVRTNVTEDGYYADFMAGLDIQIGNVKINKKMFGEDVTIEKVTSEKEISGGGVYFIGDNGSIKLVKTGESSYLVLNKDLVLIGDGSEQQGKVVSTVGTYLEGASLYCKDIEFEAQNINPCIQVRNAEVPVVVFDRCKIDIPAADNVNYPSFLRSNTDYGIENVYITNSIIKNNRALGKELRLINIDAANTAATQFKNVLIKNNLFYSAVGGNASFGLVCVNNNNTTTSVGVPNLTLQNNTFAGLSKGGMIQGDVTNIIIEKNIFCSTDNVALFRRRGNVSSGNVVTATMQGRIKDNLGYTTKGDFNIVYSGAAPIPAGVDGENITKLGANPYSTYDLSNGEFVISTEYAGYGATLE